MRIQSDSRGCERFAGEDNDCTVRALANALGMPYKLAHGILAKAGRKPKHGMVVSAWHPVYERLGLKLQSVHGSTKGARFVSHKYNNPAGSRIAAVYKLEKQAVIFDL